MPGTIPGFFPTNGGVMIWPSTNPPDWVKEIIEENKRRKRKPINILEEYLELAEASKKILEYNKRNNSI